MEKNSHHTEINNIKIENVTYSSSTEINNVSNHYFTQAGPRLANDIPAIDTSFREYITPTQHTFSIYEINSNDVYKIIAQFRYIKIQLETKDITTRLRGMI